jgi:hypothetical protein
MMRTFGFSTGALALGDFRAALKMLEGKEASAVELSALRDHELPALASAAADLDLGRFTYVSVHAPSRFGALSEREAAKRLSFCIQKGWPVVIHPDVLRDFGAWRPFGELLCIENMDKRKVAGRTVAELEPCFAELPQASFCLDFGHARQVDSTLLVVRQLLVRFGSRLRQIHFSELDNASHHRPLSIAALMATQQVVHLFPDVPVIIESRVGVGEIDRELAMARRSFAPKDDSFAGGPVRVD